MDLLVPKLYTQKGRNIIFDSSQKVLNLGCGSQRYPNVTGIDVVESDGVDIVHDLNKMPWPIKAGTVNVILAFHVMEHVDDLPRVMEEIHRVSKPGAHIVIEVPYFRSILAFQDPTHRRFFTTRSLDYFSHSRPLGFYHYASTDFDIADFWLGWPTSSWNPLTRFMKMFFHRHQDFYDSHLSRVFPVPILVFELVVKK
ncbi:MAG: class I SAM-dependent methyltransferase [Patescibacteria group bacterium]